MLNINEKKLNKLEPTFLVLKKPKYLLGGKTSLSIITALWFQVRDCL